VARLQPCSRHPDLLGRARPGPARDPLYAATKAAVRSLGRGFAADPGLLGQQIRVNTLSFGAVSTPMTGAASPDLASAMRAWG